MKIGIVAFCKTIGKSPVKTRLANDIGIENAEKFYSLSIACVCELLDLVSSDSVSCFWAIAEREELQNPMWKSHNVIWTGEGGLGERLWNVSQCILKEFDAAIMIGTDIPQLTSSIIAESVRKLEKRQLVLGPGKDGGFYLFGSSLSVSSDIWKSVEYSKSDTLMQFKKAMSSIELYPYEIETLQDVDTKNDLFEVSYELEKLGKCRTKTQDDLFMWIQKFKSANE